MGAPERARRAIPIARQIAEIAEIAAWQAEAARCERLRLGVYNAAVAAELDALAADYRCRAACRLADLGPVR